MPKLRPYPFWISAGTPRNEKLPKIFRMQDFSTREIQKLVKDEKTGIIRLRTADDKKCK